jgi:hypothetical protein
MSQEGVNADAANDHAVSSIDQVDGALRQGERADMQNTPGHKCGLCDVTFETKLQLSSHKRIHQNSTKIVLSTGLSAGLIKSGGVFTCPCQGYQSALASGIQRHAKSCYGAPSSNKPTAPDTSSLAKEPSVQSNLPTLVEIAIPLRGLRSLSLFLLESLGLLVCGNCCIGIRVDAGRLGEWSLEYFHENYANILEKEVFSTSMINSHDYIDTRSHQGASTWPRNTNY